MKNKIILFVFAFLIVHCTLNIEDCMCQWHTYTLPYSGIANTLEFYNLNLGISCGHTLLGFNERIFYTTNSGTNWIQATCPLEIRAMIDIQFINSSTIYGCGAENVSFIKSDNIYNDFSSFPRNIRDKFLIEGKRENSAFYKSAFLKSTDGGINWQKIEHFDNQTGYINDIHFFNSNTGYSLIDSNPVGNTKFYKTTNGGLNWISVKLIEPNSTVTKMKFFDMNTGIACGFKSGGRIYKTTDAGSNWSIKVFVNQIDDFTFLNSSTGIAIGVVEGGHTIIYKTTNAGNQWDSSGFIGNSALNNIESLPSTGTAFASGNAVDTLFSLGKINTIKTTDYGLNWIKKEFLPSTMASGLKLADQNNFFISGGNMNESAIILKSTNGGAVFVNHTGNEVPGEFRLFQNYPNPFNAVTIIKFSVPLSPFVTLSPHHFVTLKVYDLLGREVATLVNENLHPGTYEISFNANALTSGIYFYRLTAGDFSATKKLVLMK